MQGQPCPPQATPRSKVSKTTANNQAEATGRSREKGVIKAIEGAAAIIKLPANGRSHTEGPLSLGSTRIDMLLLQTSVLLGEHLKITWKPFGLRPH